MSGTELIEQGEVDETGEGEEVEAVEDEQEKPAHIIRWEEDVLGMEKEVATAAVEFARSNATTKATKKRFEALTDELSSLLNHVPTANLFDSTEPKKCRECGCEEDAVHYFPAPDLCQVCADNLDPDDPRARQVQEVLDTCPACGGTEVGADGEICLVCNPIEINEPEQGSEAE